MRKIDSERGKKGGKTKMEEKIMGKWEKEKRNTKKRERRKTM